MNPDAKIVELNGIVYEERDWLYEEEDTYTKNQFFGIVKEGMSNSLPLGSKMYQAKENEALLIIEVDDKTFLYMAAQGE